MLWYTWPPNVYSSAPQIFDVNHWHRVWVCAQENCCNVKLYVFSQVDGQCKLFSWRPAETKITWLSHGCQLPVSAVSLLWRPIDQPRPLYTHHDTRSKFGKFLYVYFLCALCGEGLSHCLVQIMFLCKKNIVVKLCTSVCTFFCTYITLLQQRCHSSERQVIYSCLFESKRSEFVVMSQRSLQT